MQKIKVYLASGSPRRQTLLKQIDVPFQCLSVDVPEVINLHESPRQNAERLALAKANAGWQAAARIENTPVLGADTVVVIGNQILEKPKDKADGMSMLQLLSGKTHEVITAVALVNDSQAITTLSGSRVEFRDISAAEVEAYWNSKEPLDKAGGYAIQGLAALFIKRIEGSYSGIMGLPLYETAELMQKFGISII